MLKTKNKKKLTLLHKNLMMQIGHTAALRIRVVAIRMHRIEPNRVVDELIPIPILVDLVRHTQRAILRRRQILVLLLLERQPAPNPARHTVQKRARHNQNRDRRHHNETPLSHHTPFALS